MNKKISKKVYLLFYLISGFIFISIFVIVFSEIGRFISPAIDALLPHPIPDEFVVYAVIFLFIFSGIFFVFSRLVIYYKGWSAIQHWNVRMRAPSARYLLLLVPLLNLYVYFHIVYGFSVDYNKFVSRFSGYRVSQKLFLIDFILVVVTALCSELPYMLPLLVMAVYLVQAFVVNQFCNAINSIDLDIIIESYNEDRREQNVTSISPISHQIKNISTQFSVDSEQIVTPHSIENQSSSLHQPVLSVACWKCRFPIEIASERRGRKQKRPSCGTRQVMPIQ